MFFLFESSAVFSGKIKMCLEPCKMLCSLCEKAILKLISMKIWLLIFTEKSLSFIYNKEFKVKLSSKVKFCDLDTESFFFWMTST